jgi:hypothetical protein
MKLNEFLGDLIGVVCLIVIVYGMLFIGVLL